MRTLGPDRGLRELAADLWRRRERLGPAARLGLPAALVGLLIAGYLSVPTDPGAGTAWVFGGHAFPEEKLATIRAVLGGGGVRKVVVDDGRVGVPADQLLVAQAAMKKAKLDPHTLDEIIDGFGATSWIEAPEVQRQRLDRVRAEVVEHLIEAMPGIVKANVVFLPLPGSGPSRLKTARALVEIGTADGERPSYRTVREARDLVLGGTDYAIKPEDVTLTSRGHPFLVAGDRTRLGKVLVHAREEELADEVAARLRDVDGVRVQVALELAAAPTWKPGRAIVNQGAAIEPEPAAEAAALDTARAAVAVRLPAGYFRRLATATAGDLAAADAAAQARERIQAAVRSAVPAAQLGSIVVEERAEPVRTAAPAAPPTAPERPTLPRWWPAAAGAGAVAALALIVATVAIGRRPSSRPARPSRRHAGDSPHAAPTGERVRALVRRNPEAAAGVLQRWVGQEGGGA